MTYSEALRELKLGRQVRRAVWHNQCRAVLIDGEICQRLNRLVIAPDSIEKAMTDWELTR